MSTKLLAMGNVLMGDDGIAVYVAANLEDSLRKYDIEVVYGETDIGYSIAQIAKEDFIIILDAARLGKTPGEITVLPFDDIPQKSAELSLHNISFLDLLKLYFPKNDGVIIAVEIDEVSFHYALGEQLSIKFPRIVQEVSDAINSIFYHLQA